MDNHVLSLRFAIMMVLLILSAFFSGSETAMMAVNRIRLRHRVKRERRARQLKEILREPEKLIGTLLLCNNVVNVGLTAIATGLAIRIWGETGMAYATFMVTIALLVVSEITPKTIAAYAPTRISMAIAPIIYRLIQVLYPLVRILTTISNLLIRAMGLRASTSVDSITEEEIRTVIEAGGDQGVLDRAKHDMLMGVLALEQTTVGDIMVPIRDVVALPANASYQEVYQIIKKTEASRYPVYQSNRNDVIGFIHVRDFLLHPADQPFSLKKILREPNFVPDLRSIRKQLLNFQKERSHLSIIVNEYGNIQGIVTLEDILEEIVGEITDEHDSLSKRSVKLPDGSYRLEGPALIRDINRWLHIQIPEEEVRTIAGLVYKELGRIPAPGDAVTVGRYHLVVEEVTKRRIGTVRLWIQPPSSVTSEGFSGP
jgi:putative hemolysin